MPTTTRVEVTAEQVEQVLGDLVAAVKRLEAAIDNVAPLLRDALEGNEGA